MATTIMRALTVPEIRKKLGFTALLLALYRVGSHIPVPGINIQAVNDIQHQFGGGGILNLLNTFSGGGLSRIALFALGIMPYITASIILQLLTVVVPALEKLQKEGEVGQARITQYTRYLTVGLAFAQSIGYVFLFRSFAPSAGQPIIPSFDAPHVFLIVLSLTAGTILLMWMGELITQRGIGNGISLMIFASIVSRFPNGVQAWWTNPDQVFKVGMPFLALGVIAAVVFIQEGQRRIPIQYAKRVIGRRMSAGGQTYLPLRVNMAGVIPGVRPGRPTAEFLDRILARLTFPGALYLAAIAALPTILINQTSANFFFGGTSILIVIGVALDTMKQIEAQMMMRNYEGFLK